MTLVGITTTIPVEVLFASQCVPKDLNNIFITDVNPLNLVELAEKEGFPRNMCAWIKGIFSAVKQSGVQKIIAVTEGDCSNTNALFEIFKDLSIEVIPFSFPQDKDLKKLALEIECLARHFNTSLENVMTQKKICDDVRKYAHIVDELTWKNGVVSGFENHFWLVNCSDFMSDRSMFLSKIKQFIDDAKKRAKKNLKYRLGYVGVPPITPDIYEIAESLNANIVYNEIQRQFSMPYKTSDLVEQYFLYTYPYDIFGRIEDIKEQIKIRDLHGIIHYTQSFCHRQLNDIVLRKHLDIPILTIESDKPSTLSAKNRIKMESFMEML